MFSLLSFGIFSSCIPRPSSGKSKPSTSSSDSTPPDSLSAFVSAAKEGVPGIPQGSSRRSEGSTTSSDSSGLERVRNQPIVSVDELKKNFTQNPNSPQPGKKSQPSPQKRNPFAFFFSRIIEVISNFFGRSSRQKSESVVVHLNNLLKPQSKNGVTDGKTVIVEYLTYEALWDRLYKMYIINQNHSAVKEVIEILRQDDHAEAEFVKYIRAQNTKTNKDTGQAESLIQKLNEFFQFVYDKKSGVCAQDSVNTGSEGDKAQVVADTSEKIQKVIKKYPVME